ncbi:hypothetical protein ABT256_21305 [Amycolatopsis japonica]|uniref:hypothetical protein n=1 Tax=Amycolatopsis japonica TaxID=208439 RepID=UPI0033275129
MQRFRVAHSGVATAPGGYANSGVHVGDVNLLTGMPVRTHYQQQVQRIAPERLFDREAELAELAEFCTSVETAGRYVWWRAEAWSGKSALMSWFVLNPPAGVRVVSFFVTSRLSSQNDRSAFVENLMEQLLALLGESLPPFLAESTREAHLLGLLTEAAEVCSARGEHFVLLVDGLDEDRGVHSDREWHSIAALLPAELPAGMRVIVAGRPNPPIPGDVSRTHPLHDPTIVRTLMSSAQAQAIRHEMERELKRLLRGTVERELLGLVAAAGGGLSAADLAELTECSQWEVDDQLRTVTGRSFAVRGNHFPAAGPDVYLLGHEELQITALEMLGSVAVEQYRERLYVWAQRYQQRGWPPNTPEYLLRGFFRMLQAVPDIPRMMSYATDPARHDRMFEISGGDAAALTEIAGTQRLLRQLDEPTLASLGVLAVQRLRLQGRNTTVPVGLPMVWARLGQVGRAVSLASGFAGAAPRAKALAGVAQVVVTHDPELFEELMRQAENLVDAIGEEDQVDVLGSLAKAAAATDNPYAARLAKRAMLAVADLDFDVQDEPLCALGCSLASSGGFDDLALELPGFSEYSEDRTRILEHLMHEFAARGAWESAEAAVDAIEETIDDHGRVSSVLAEALARAGHESRGIEIARSIRNVNWRTVALAAVASQIAGESHSRAAGLLEEAEVDQLSLGARFHFDAAAAVVQYYRDPSRFPAAVGKAEHTARSFSSAEGGSRMLATLATMCFPVAERLAQRLAVNAIADVASETYHGTERDKLCLFEMFVEAGMWDQADSAARAVRFPHVRAERLTELAGALVDVDLGLAASAAEAAGLYARSDTDWPRPAQEHLFELLIAVECWSEAEWLLNHANLEHGFEGRRSQLELALAKHGLWDDAARIHGQADAEPGWRDRLRVNLIREFVRTDESARAVRELPHLTAGFYKADAAFHVLQHLLRREKWDVVEQIVVTEPDAELRRQLADMLMSQVAAECPDRRAGLVERLLTVVDGRDAEWSSEAPASLVRALAWGAPENVVDGLFAELIDDEDEDEDEDGNSRLAETASRAAEALAQDGRWSKAEQLVCRLRYAGDRANALADLVAVAVSRGAPHTRRLARLVEENLVRLPIDERGQVTMRLCGALAAGSLIKQAERVARAIEKPLERAEAWVYMAQAVAGRHAAIAEHWLEQATSTIDSVSDSEDSEHLSGVVARALANSGFIERAEPIADGIRRTSIRSMVFGEIARVFARKQRWEDAERVVRKIENEAVRSAAIEVVVRKLAVAPDRDDVDKAVVRRLLADSLIARSEFSALVAASAGGLLRSEIVATCDAIRMVLPTRNED